MITKYWRFIGISLLKRYRYWYEFAEMITNKAPTNKGKHPLKCGMLTNMAFHFIRYQ